jgi:hypothetical protein
MWTRQRPILSRSPPGAFAFAVLILIACGSPIVARIQLDGFRFALPFLLGVAIQAMAANQCHTPADLWKSRSLIIASLGVFMTLLLTSLSLWRADNTPSIYITYGATVVAAGTRPVVAAFFQERARARVDSQDTFFAAGGVWAMVSGVVTLLMVRSSTPTTGVFVDAHGRGGGITIGVATVALGAALTLGSIARSHLRIQWLHRVAEGGIAGYYLDVWDQTVNAALPPLFENSAQDEDAARLVLFRGSKSIYRSRADEAVGVVSGYASSSRPTRWVREVLAGTVAPLVLTCWLYLCSFASGDSLKGL